MSSDVFDVPFTDATPVSSVPIPEPVVVGSSDVPAKPKYASKQAIFGISDMKIEDLYVPEWDVTVRIRSLTGFERDTFENSLIDQRGKKNKLDMRNARAKLVALCVIDEDGNRMFEDSEIGMLGMKNAAALDKIYDVASRMCGMSDADIEELTGNLKDDPKGGNTSGLRVI